MLTVSAMASRSRFEGWQGIRIRSASRAAISAALSDLGAVSMMTRSAPPVRARSIRSARLGPCPGRMTGVSAARRRDQRVALCWGSRSMMTTLLALERGCDGEVQADGRLAGTALLGKHCDGFHRSDAGTFTCARERHVGMCAWICAHRLGRKAEIDGGQRLGADVEPCATQKPLDTADFRDCQTPGPRRRNGWAYLTKPRILRAP